MRDIYLYPERGLPGEWADNAACKDAPTSWFYPRFGSRNTGEKSKIMNAKKLCSSCPVKRECLEWALESGEEDGIWGGFEPKERYEMIDKPNSGVPKYMGVV